jgi:serine/threonine protein kinase
MDGAHTAPDRKARVIAGRYSLDREVGRGGTGAVWLGRDEVLGRPVALKRIGLLPGADRTDLTRAEREAKLSARLHHPHVVAIFDAVIDDDTDAWWMVMEYVDGVDLSRLVRERGPISPDQAAPLLAQAAGALAAAHAAGIVHRDVKPSNILVDRAGQVKLTDFGIARIATDPALTQTGMVTGSPAYLAPEVAAGARGDEASDVWSLGATMFHVLEGRPPYDLGDNVIGGLYRIVHEEPPRPTDAGWLAPLLEATMVRDPSRRWSMQQVHAYLDSGVAPPPMSDPTATQVLTPVRASPAPSAPAPAPAPAPEPAPSGGNARTSPSWLWLLGFALVLVLAVVGYVLLTQGGPGSGGTANGSAGKGSGSATSTTKKPTEKGMEAFIRDYVSTVSTDPSKSWMMLTPKFQEESGGFGKYQSFWDPATNGQVLSISADPKNLTVSYQVHFDDFDNGPGPTVLDLKYVNGKYLIDGEHTRGFKPVG